MKPVEYIITAVLLIAVAFVIFLAFIRPLTGTGKSILEPIGDLLGLTEKSKCQKEGLAGFLAKEKDEEKKLYCEKSKQCLSLSENVCDPNTYKPKGCNDWCNADSCNKGPCPVELGCLNNQCAKCGKTGDSCEGVWPFNTGQCCDGFKCIDMHLNIWRGHCEKR